MDNDTIHEQKNPTKPMLRRYLFTTSFNTIKKTGGRGGGTKGKRLSILMKDSHLEEI